MTVLTDGVVEELVFFPCGEETLAGVLTVPSRPKGQAVVLAWGGGTFPSSGRNRIRTYLARILAGEGYHCFRFDYVGVGESSGSYRPPHLSAPYSDQIAAAAAWLVSKDLDRIVLVGNCFGAWSALMAAPSIPSLEGLALSGPPVRRDHKQSIAANTTWRWWLSKLRGFQLRKLLDADRRARYRTLVGGKMSAMLHPPSMDTRFSEAIEAVVERRLPILIVHAENELGADVVAELDRGLAEVLNRAPQPTRVIGIKDTLGSSFATQTALIDAIQVWMRDLHRATSLPGPTTAR